MFKVGGRGGPRRVDDGTVPNQGRLCLRRVDESWDNFGHVEQGEKSLESLRGQAAHKTHAG